LHESSLTENLFEHVLIHAKQANARRVTRVKVTIGALSDATPDSITFYFDALAPGTLVEGAGLEFESAPGRAHCSACEKEFEIADLYAACPQCGAFPLKVTSGNGVYLSSLEVETDDNRQEHVHE
jgi:hydrogenase nickel incorporation protein HypA/HybF